MINLRVQSSDQGIGSEAISSAEFLDGASVIENADGAAAATLAKLETSQDLWQRSPEFNQLFKKGQDKESQRLLVFVLTFISALMWSVAILLFPLRRQLGAGSWWATWITFIQLLLTLLGCLIAGSLGAWYIAARKAFYDRVRFQKAVDIARSLDELRAEGGLSLQNLLLLNRKQLDEYHVITVRQQAAAFRNAELAAILSFVLLVTAALITFRSGDSLQGYVSGGLSAIGSALSGFVSSMFFRSYRDTTSELERYSREPLYTASILMIERFLQDAGQKGEAAEERCAEMRLKIVERLLELLQPPYPEETSR